MEMVEHRLLVLPAETTQYVQEHLIKSGCTVFLNVKCEIICIVLRPPCKDANATPCNFAPIHIKWNPVFHAT
jgi:hypothetical protein